MSDSLLIVGAGVYGLVAKEIAESMGCFENIAFVDDQRECTPNGIAVAGRVSDIADLSSGYSHVIVAIGAPAARLGIMEELEKNANIKLASLISPLAYVSPSAELAQGCIVEPMAVIHTGCVLKKGCIVSAGAVVNHCSLLFEGVHVDCNATVAGNTAVPAGTKVHSGELFQGDRINVFDLCL